MDFLQLLQLFLLKTVSFFPNVTRFLSLITLSDILLSLYFRYFGLSPYTIDLDDQTVIHFWIPKQKQIKKPSLILIHGFGGNSKWQFYQQVGSLYRDFNLYVPDLVFFGKSYSKTTDKSDVFQARCVGEGMQRLGVNKFSVFGISYGGYVACRMADIYREEVEKVVILSCGICCTDEQKEYETNKIGKDIAEILVPERPEDLRVLMNQVLYRPPSFVPDFLLQDFINVMCMANRREKMEMVYHLLHTKADINPPVLNQETLILWGDKDNVFPLHLGHQLARYLGKKNRVEIIKDAGHAAHSESPKLVNCLIKSFILAANK